MKKSIISALTVLLFTTAAFAGKDKTTFKEKIENSKEVKVYFNVTEIVDRESDRKMKQTNPNASTDIRTNIPAKFSSDEVKNNVVSILNTEMQVNAFKLANISDLGKSNDKQTQFLDLSKLPDGIIAIIQVEGDYTRFVDMAKGGEVSNRMEIKVNMFFYEIKGGVAKKIKVNMGMGANLGSTSTSVIKTPKLEGLDYLQTNFPALSLLENYTNTIKEYSGDFAKRMLKKHQKTVAKR